MADFYYEAFDVSGASVSGVIEAESKQQALQKLQANELSVASIEVQKQASGSGQLFDRITLADLEFFTTEMSLLLASGVRVDKGIEIILKAQQKQKFRQLLASLSADIRSGKSLADAMAEHPEVFKPLYVNLIRLGESSGDLTQVFNGLSEDLVYQRELRGNIISALTYPAVILAVCVLSIVFIFNYIVPQMSSLFEGVEELPVYTQALLGLSDWMSQYQWFLLLAIVILVVALVSGLRQPEFKARWDKLITQMPGIRKPALMVERIRFCGGLSMMLTAGMKINRAMQLSLGNLTNQRLIRQVEIAIQKVRAGGRLKVALEQTDLFPPIYTSLLEVGEESGNLEAIFTEITRRTRNDFSLWTKRMTTLIEPLLILFMGTIVGGVVIIMLLSMVSVNDIGL